MSIATVNEPGSGAVKVVAPPARCPVIIDDQTRIPAWVSDFNTFRQWTQSEQFPENGLIAFLQGEIWADLSMEEFLTHNQVKFAMMGAFYVLSREINLGKFVPDRMRWFCKEAGLSTEPDALFASWKTWQTGRLHSVKGKQGGIIELEGTPDMMLEIVSASSVNKDTIQLRDLYWRAGIQEYWLVDARPQIPRLDILRYTSAGYVETQTRDGWLDSVVFGRAFKLTKQADLLGDPVYELLMRQDEKVP